VAQSRPARALTGTSASNKLEARRLQMLVKQRERLEEEMQALETEVDHLVSNECRRLSVQNLNTIIKLRN
jgi:uncharacterized protein (UPF0335 family)